MRKNAFRGFAGVHAAAILVPALAAVQEEHSLTGGAALLWEVRDDTAAGLLELSGAVAVGGGRVIVATSAQDVVNGWIVVSAFDGATGAMLWEVRHEVLECCSTLGDWQMPPIAGAVLSPAASRVHVVGRVKILGPSVPIQEQEANVLLTLDAATGAELSATTYAQPDGSSGTLERVALSADGAVLFGSGRIKVAPGIDFPEDHVLTAALDASSGQLLWQAVYDPDPGDDADALGLAVDPGGGAVYVTSMTQLDSSGYDYVTVAYSAADGATLWEAHWPNVSDWSKWTSEEMSALSPDGERLVVAIGRDIVAYAAATGSQEWASTLEASDHAFGAALSFGPDSTVVYATAIYLDGSDEGTLVAAFDAATGAILWSTPATSGGFGIYSDVGIAVSPDGETVFAATPGDSDEPTALALDAADGSILWVSPGARASGDEVDPFGIGVALDAGAGVLAVGCVRFDETYDPKTADASVRAVATDGTGLWLTALGSEGSGQDTALDVALAPGGGQVAVAGSTDEAGGWEYRMWAHGPAGAPLWSYAGEVMQLPLPRVARVAYAPDGSTVHFARPAETGLAIHAFAASNGTELWAELLPANFLAAFGLGAGSLDLIVGPASGRVFVTRTKDYNYATAALDPITGALLWEASYNPAGLTDFSAALALAPDEATVLVTGRSMVEAALYYDAATVAYDATSGAELWAARYFGIGGNGEQVGNDVAVSPDGARVVTAGRTALLGGAFHFGWVLAHDAASGVELWSEDVAGADSCLDVCVTADTAFVLAALASPSPGLGVFALDLADGSQRWHTAVLPSAVESYPSALELESDGTTLFVTGSVALSPGAHDALTAALDASTGELLWTAIYDGGLGDDSGAALTLDAPGHRLFVASTTAAAETHDDILLAAYAVPSLVGQPDALSTAAGGTQDLLLRADAWLAGALYLVAGSLSGTEPGFAFGPLHVPLNPDPYFFITLGSPASPLFYGLGQLDAAAQAKARLVIPPGVAAALVGTSVAHAYGVLDPLSGTAEFASNPVMLELLP
jgi:outer membrane protein assembly factor BamB